MLGLLGLAALLVLPIAGPAGAREAPRDAGPSRSIASFEGVTIDLSKDWGDAHACIVWRQGGVFECFRTDAELDAREAKLSLQSGAPREPESTSASPAVAYSSWCSSSLRLYDYNWYGGRRLSFWDRGFWQNLSDYGFEDRTSSYIVGGCYSYLAEHADGGGWWYPGPSFPYAGEPIMLWDWQDRISSIYIS